MSYNIPFQYFTAYEFNCTELFNDLGIGGYNADGGSCWSCVPSPGINDYWWVLPTYTNIDGSPFVLECAFGFKKITDCDYCINCATLDGVSNPYFIGSGFYRCPQMSGAAECTYFNGDCSSSYCVDYTAYDLGGGFFGECPSVSNGSVYENGYPPDCQCEVTCSSSYHYNSTEEDCLLDGSDCAAGTYWDGTACSATILQKGLSFVRHTLTGRLYVAYIDSNNLKVDIYTDAQTDTVGSTVTVDASGNCTAPRIICREDGVIEIIYITGTNVKITQSRDSGTTWAVATTIVTSGYQLATYGIPATMSGYSIIPVMLWNDSKWYVKVGVKTGASTYTFSSAVQVVASAAALPATLLQRKDGVWEFLYTALPNTKTIIRCKALRSDGTGTWS